mgnify:CR=1 FL=1
MRLFISILAHLSNSDTIFSMQQPEITAFYDKPTGSWTYVVAIGQSAAVFDPVLGFDPVTGATSTDGADQIIAYVRSRALICEWVIDTHIHADHLTAMPYIKQHLGGRTGITIKVRDSLALWAPKLNLGVPMDGSQFDHLFDEKGFQFAGTQVQMMHAPGHTPADTVFVIGDAALVGDCLLMLDEGTGRCDFPGGSAADSWNSIQRIFTLPDATRVFVAHSYTDPPQHVATIADHKQNNVRLKAGTDKNAYVTRRNADDAGKSEPKLMKYALPVNLRAGSLL